LSLETVTPREPESLQEAGLSESTVEQLLLRILYFRGDLYGQELSTAIGLKFSVIQKLVEMLQLSHHLQVKRSMGMGSVGSVFTLTEAGRARTREHLESNQYYGPAPVPLAQYTEIVRKQRQRDGWLTKEALAKAFRGMVLTESIVSQIGPAVSSANSLLLYGKPGDGKTYLIESLANLETEPIFLPYALECQGNIIQVYDPIYHQRVEEEDPQSDSSMSVCTETASYDRRWARCKRPFIVSGGELSVEMLDLRFNHTSKVYEAPFQLKANNGIYLIDDFGRQRATPAEVLNRWIVPMERRLDYLSFLTGGKMTAPFEIFLVFSTNLNPADLGDEAFLRRIQYKMLLRGPSEVEFIRIFETFCATRRLPFPRDLLRRFLDRHYKQTGKVFRRCHPRDLLSHALNLIHFEKLPFALTEEILDRAFNGCFLEENPNETVREAAILPMASSTCWEYWSGKIAEVDTSFGGLVVLARGRNDAADESPRAESDSQFGEGETVRVLDQLHRQELARWRALGRDRQARDMVRYLESAGVEASALQAELREWVGLVMPPGSDIEDTCLFTHDLTMVLETLCPAEVRELRPQSAVEPVPLQRSA
jgi:hypothetical protein